MIYEYYRIVFAVIWPESYVLTKGFSYTSQGKQCVFDPVFRRVLGIVSCYQIYHLYSVVHFFKCVVNKN